MLIQRAFLESPSGFANNVLEVVEAGDLKLTYTFDHRFVYEEISKMKVWWDYEKSYELTKELSDTSAGCEICKVSESLRLLMEQMDSLESEADKEIIRRLLKDKHYSVELDIEFQKRCGGLYETVGNLNPKYIGSSIFQDCESCRGSLLLAIYRYHADILFRPDMKALLYGVETRIVNQAVRNNPKKFPKDYIIELDEEDSSALRSKILTLEQKGGKGRHSKYNIKAFTEKGLYMLATILKTPRAIEATLAIIETFAMTRQLARTMEALQTAEDGGEQQKGLLQKTGEILADIVGTNLSTADTETEIEFNFAVVKIKHKVVRSK